MKWKTSLVCFSMNLFKFSRGKGGIQMYISAYFGSEAWRARRDKGWTQEEVAERAGISTRWYQQIECGVVNATFAVCVRIARVLGLDLNQLCTLAGI